MLCITLPKLIAAAGPPRSPQARLNRYFCGHDLSVSIAEGLNRRGSNTGGRYVAAHSVMREPIRAWLGGRAE